MRMSQMPLLGLIITIFVLGTACSGSDFTSAAKHDKAKDHDDAGKDDNIEIDGEGTDVTDGADDGKEEIEETGEINEIDIDATTPIGIDSLFSNVSKANIRPVLAISDNVPCFSCHGKIQGDLLTDFALQARPMATRTYADAFTAIRSHHQAPGTPDGLASLDLRGTLIIPKLKAYNDVEGAPGVSFKTHFTQAGTTMDANFSLKDALTKPRRGYIEGDTSIKAETVIAFPVIDKSRGVNIAGIDGIKEVTKLKITTPSESNIRALLAESKAATKDAKSDVKVMTWTKNDVADGFTIEPEGYVLATQEVTCKGDVLIDGILVIKDAQFASNARGCRLYVTRSIFIVGEASIAGSDQATLQMVSGVGIAIGLKDKRSRGLAASPLFPQGLIADIDKMAAINGLLIEAGPFAELWKDNVKVATSYEVFRVLDGSTPAGYTMPNWTPIPGQSIPADCVNATLNARASCYVAWTMLDRQQQDYDHIVMIAPTINSRYHGKIRGMMVAEAALFALVNLEFEFDDRLKKSIILPRLTKGVVDFAE